MRERVKIISLLIELPHKHLYFVILYVTMILLII